MFAGNHFAGRGGKDPLQEIFGGSKICGFPAPEILGRVPSSKIFTGLICPIPQRVLPVSITLADGNPFPKNTVSSALPVTSYDLNVCTKTHPAKSPHFALKNRRINQPEFWNCSVSLTARQLTY